MSQGVDTRLCLPKTAWPPTLMVHAYKINLMELRNEVKIDAKKQIKKQTNKEMRKLLAQAQEDRLIIAKLEEEKRIEELPKLLLETLPFTLALALFLLADFLVTGGNTTLTIGFNHLLNWLGFNAIIPV